LLEGRWDGERRVGWEAKRTGEREEEGEGGSNGAAGAPLPPPPNPKTLPPNPAQRTHVYVRQLAKRSKKRLEGCSAHTTNLPMASASAVVVATTSESEGLMKTL